MQERISGEKEKGKRKSGKEGEASLRPAKRAKPMRDGANPECLTAAK
jgi:hypothetical protein